MLSYDQIPQDRYVILEAAGRLGDEGHAGVLGAALAEWAARDDSKPDAFARRAANTAMDAIDAALAELHSLRSRLVGEMRASDDATAARVDALLGRGSAPGRDATPPGGRDAPPSVPGRHDPPHSAADDTSRCTRGDASRVAMADASYSTAVEHDASAPSAG